MTREQYRAWADRQPCGRFERHHGIVVAMAPERAGHALRKARAWSLLDQAVRSAGLPCQAFPDGMTVEIGDSDYEPDAVLRCGAPLPNDSIAVPDPLLIVEVLSPATSTTDRSHKLREYFRLASLRHYLIVWPDTPRVVHHRLTDAGEVATEVFTEGAIRLDPPGIRLDLAALYAG